MISLQSQFDLKLNAIMSIKSLLAILIFALASPMISAQMPAPEMTRSVEFTTTTAYITIDGMACQEGCANTIAKNLEETKGIQSAEISYDDGKAIVKFDDNLIQIAEIENIITSTKVKDYVYSIKNSVLKNSIVR